MAKSTKDEREQFRVGDWVSVAGWVAQDEDERGRRIFVPHPSPNPPRVGQVVGATRMMTGWRDRGFDAYGEDYEPPSFTADGSVLVWLVRFSVTTKPWHIFAEQLTPCAPLDRLPWR